jgi:hypothetical protein
MGLLDEIRAISPVQAMDLELLGKSGNVDALKKWVLYSAWDRIQADRTVDAKQKVRLFKTILDFVNLDVQFVAEPAPPSPPVTDSTVTDPAPNDDSVTPWPATLPSQPANEGAD